MAHQTNTDATTPTPQTTTKTRILILSDTHALEPPTALLPHEPADLAIHCGDLTQISQLDEYRATRRLLRAVNAPLKLVIAGNHDYSLHREFFERRMERQRSILKGQGEVLRKAYGEFGDAKVVLENGDGWDDGEKREEEERHEEDDDDDDDDLSDDDDSDDEDDKEDDDDDDTANDEDTNATYTHNNNNAPIHLLSEGIHTFTLQNGARVTIYASPWTPTLGGFAFQYPRREGHNFDLHTGVGANGVDIAVTHGPPRGVLDRTLGGDKAGCADLFAAVARARPRLHCFGHIHEAWGAKVVRWREQEEEQGGVGVDEENSVVVQDLEGLADPAAWKERRRQRCYATSHCAGDRYPLEHKAQTLFVNAAMLGRGNRPVKLPWLVDLELPTAEAP